ncbi:MAG: hypothetical protein R3C02_01415 [Planctomycetaceae bacterium]
MPPLIRGPEVSPRLVVDSPPIPPKVELLPVAVVVGSAGSGSMTSGSSSSAGCRDGCCRPGQCPVHSVWLVRAVRFGPKLDRFRIEMLFKRFGHLQQARLL